MSQAPSAQVDSFNRASSGRGGKLGRLFSGRSRPSPKTPNTASPAKSDPPTPPTGPSLSLDDMLIYQPVRPSSLSFGPLSMLPRLDAIQA